MYQQILFLNYFQTQVVDVVCLVAPALGLSLVLGTARADTLFCSQSGWLTGIF
jgi:hypothetical protein